MRPEKTTIVEDLSVRLNASPFLIVTEYAGMNVSEFAELRHRLARAGAIVTGETDVCAAAKVLKTFSTEFQRPSVKVGVLDHAVISKEQIQTLADLPAKPVLQAQLLGVLKSPLQKLVTVLNEPGASLVRLLKAKVDKEGGAEG
jgi:large subunit ribosomal protein L10